MKLHWILAGLAASAAILAAGFLLSPRATRGVAAAMPTSLAVTTIVRQDVRPAARPAQAARTSGLAFADRFAGAPVWESSYAVRTEGRASYAAAPTRSLQPVQAQRAIDAVASRAPTFQLASASSESIEVPSAPSTPSVAMPAAPSEARSRPMTIASAVAAFSEPESKIAIYDIAAHTVYMPNGDKLEAHSGLGERLDNPRYVNVKMKGPTPPNVYKLSLRERVFHGVRAIRLTPVDESKMFGRDGMLAHTYMLRNRGHSNGCVVFENYQLFLNAFLRGEVDRMVVVERLDRKPTPAARVASVTP